MGYCSISMSFKLLETKRKKKRACNDQLVNEQHEQILKQFVFVILCQTSLHLSLLNNGHCLAVMFWLTGKKTLTTNYTMGSHMVELSHVSVTSNEGQVSLIAN